MKRAPRSRWIEITLMYIGISLIGFSLGASFDRWRYQKEQNELFSQVVRADAQVVSPPPVEAPRIASSSPDSGPTSSARSLRIWECIRQAVL